MPLLLSNATAAGAFSLDNIVKDKLRNRMAIKSCEAVIRARYSIKNVAGFKATQAMLDQFNFDGVYASKFVETVRNIIKRGSREDSREQAEVEKDVEVDLNNSSLDDDDI